MMPAAAREMRAAARGSRPLSSAAQDAALNTTVRTSSSFTAGVEALRDWLITCGIKTAALESTGNYWI